MSGPRSCPYLKACEVPVTKAFFHQFCAKQYQGCIHYARRTRSLKRPMEWLQKIAVDRASEKPGRSYTHLRERWERV